MISTNDSKIKFSKDYIRDKQVLELKYILEKQKIVFIKGIVKNPSGNIIKNAGIEITEINIIEKKEKVIGITFTNEYGEYGFVLEVKCSCDYNITVYTPL